MTMANLTVLLVNKFYHDVGKAGGVGRYLLQEEEDLTAAGWRTMQGMSCASCRSDQTPDPGRQAR